MALILGGLAAVSLGGYLVVSATRYRSGFPLDDAWIHQAYARNLTEGFEWSFLSGKPSAGSTSPLWAAMLAIGYLLRLDPLVWTFFLGWLTLASLGWLAFLAWPALIDGKDRWALWVGIGILAEWHLVWAAGSGMETLLAGLIFTAVLLGLVRKPIHWGSTGALAGLAIWIRPDALTLLGPVGLVWLAGKATGGGRIRSGLRFAAGYLLFFVPYLLFNLSLAGSLWPNTFYAKQAEYAILQGIPYLVRLVGQVRLPLVGAGILLLPGFVIFTREAWRGRRWGALAGITWWLGYLGLYAWRLPVSYQHGRYLMPAMPVFFLFGMAGVAMLAVPGARSFWPRLLSRTWLIAVAITLLGFWWMGAGAYGRDVAFIESEMVEMARWLEENTEPEDLIAAHDIGALGYFSGRELVDMAGLVSPDVIPFIRDERQLAVYLNQRGVRYLVTFPTWYPELVSGLSPHYQTNGEVAPQLGGENMAVYIWP